MDQPCGACGTENPAGNRFCGQCGARLDESTFPAFAAEPVLTAHGQVTSAAPGTPDAERRQLTVMFCDLVASTPLAERLDPEDLREVVRAYREVCIGAIGRVEGHLAKYLGDGVLVYFGYPRAHEDDARRAVHAGLEILAALPSLNARLQQTVRALEGSPLRIRIGVHTGPVVVGEIAAGEYSEPMAVVGETPTVAARLQEMAQPDTLVITAATHRLTQGFFHYEELGDRLLKGLSVPVRLYHVLTESGVQSRLEAARGAERTPLVGRDEEIELLLKSWERVRNGGRSAMLLSGEAGIGKSRLLEVLKERLASESLAWLDWRSSPYHQNSALYPVIDCWQRILKFRRDDSTDEKLDKLEGALAPFPFAAPEVVPLLASLLSVPLAGRYRPLELTPQGQKKKTLDLLRALLQEMAARQPVVLAVEDLHWVDPSTLELLGLLLDAEQPARVFLLLTARPDFVSPWSERPTVTHISLNHLSQEETEVIVERITGGKALPAEVLQQVVTRTDGIPLFVEELTRMVLDSGLLEERDRRYALAGPLPPLAIPTTLQDSLMARLDRLASVKEVAQLAATIGREFSYELLQAVSRLDELALQRGLAQLVDAELLYTHGGAAQKKYLFKHALVQESAYQSLLKSTRARHHQRIAQVLEARFPETAETQPELLAHHYTEAGLASQAIAYWKRAGESATARSANLEAIGHLTRGLALIERLADSPERTEHEITLRIALGAPLMVTKGWAAPDVMSNYTRARELCEQLGETPQLFTVTWGLWLCRFGQAKWQTARKIGEQLLGLAQRLHDPALILQAHHALGPSLVMLGEYVEARAHLEQAISLYDPEQHRSHAFLYGGHDPGMCCLHLGALAWWMLGYPDQARDRSRRGLMLARQLAHPASLAHAHAFGAICHQLCRGHQQTEELAEAAVSISTLQGLPQYRGQGSVLRGWALAEQGHRQDGIAQILQGLTAYRATGTGQFRLYFPALLAEIYRREGRIGEGLTVLAEALAAMNNGEERFYEPELYRLKGELLLALSSQNEAEAEICYRQAVEAARRQSAKSLELRAVRSLCRLWQRQGKKEGARQMLAESYGWFTEGFETTDLHEARALLEALS